MKANLKKLTILSMVCAMLLSLTGCSLFDSKTKVYSKYITSLLDINYKNITDDYTTLTGVSYEDAVAVYEKNMDYQAHNLMRYYGVKEVDDGTVLYNFYMLAQSIFADAKYEVTNVTHDKETDDYTIELTIYPLDTLETSHDEIVAYINSFNARVDEGDYNNTSEIDYETEFAEGIMKILKNTTEKPGYMDPVVIEIPIQMDDDHFYISDEDFLEIDKNILFIRENEAPADNNAEE